MEYIQSILKNEILIGAVIGGVFTLVGSYLSLYFQIKRDREQRAYDNKKLACENIVTELIKIFKEKEKIKADQQYARNIYMNIAEILITYGSATILKKWRKFQSIAKNPSDNTENQLALLYSVEDIIIQIRKELDPQEKYKQKDFLKLLIPDLE